MGGVPSTAVTVSSGTLVTGVVTASVVASVSAVPVTSDGVDFTVGRVSASVAASSGTAV